MNEEGQEFEPRAEDEMMSLNLAEVSQCVLPGNNRNEIEVQFPESDTVEAGTDQLGKAINAILYSVLIFKNVLLATVTVDVAIVDWLSAIKCRITHSPFVSLDS